jgi:hypothetical protein
MVAFTGWPTGAVAFYEGLEADNSKAYFTAHRAEYDELVLAPMQSMLADLAGEFGEGASSGRTATSGSAPTSPPYKTAIGATVGGSGYVHFSAAGLGVGAGLPRHVPPTSSHGSARPSPTTGAARRSSPRCPRSRRAASASRRATA